MRKKKAGNFLGRLFDDRLFDTTDKNLNLNLNANDTTIPYNIPDNGTIFNNKSYHSQIPEFYEASKLNLNSSFQLKGGKIFDTNNNINLNLNNVSNYTDQFKNVGLFNNDTNYLLGDLNNDTKYKPIFDNINIKNVPQPSYFGLGGNTYDEIKYINKLLDYIIKDSYKKFTKKEGGNDDDNINDIYLKTQDLNIKSFSYLPPQQKIN